MELERVVDCRCAIGEGPLWHPGEGRLYWTDIAAGRLFRYDPVSDTHEQVYEGDPVGGFTLQADGALLLFMARGAVKIWREGVLETVLEEIPDERETRFNDVIADPAGRVFCGTMPTQERAGRLYRLDCDGTPTVVLEDVGISNGLGFTPDRRRMYYTDSARREISLFDYDRHTGEIANRRTFVRVPEGEGVPDGLTVDVEGYVWSARWDGGCVVRYAPDGREVLRVSLPARKVSSAAFGGVDYADVYLTTAGGGDRDVEGPGAGALFRFTPGVRGMPEFESRVKLP